MHEAGDLEPRPGPLPHSAQAVIVDVHHQDAHVLVRTRRAALEVIEDRVPPAGDETARIDTDHDEARDKRDQGRVCATLSPEGENRSSSTGRRHPQRVL